MKKYYPTLIYRTTQLGLTLVELMIAMTLGLILIAGVIQVFIGSKQSYRVTDNNSRIQENGRYAVEALSRDIRVAGYRGCSKYGIVNNMAKPVTSTWTQYSKAIIGYTLPSVPAGLTEANVLAGTDVIQIQYASSAGVTVRVNNADTAQIQISGNTAGFAADDILVISDCTQTDVFRANSVSNSGGMVNITHSTATNTGTAPKLSKIYGSDAEVLRLATNVYYVGSGAGACPANTLCRQSINTANFNAMAVEELVDNVEDLAFTYGMDITDNGFADQYVEASSVATLDDWDKVNSVRFALRLRSPENNLTTSTSATFGDKRLRRTFSATVAIRNILP